MKFSYFKQSNNTFGLASIGRGITGSISTLAPQLSAFIGEHVLLRPYGKRHYSKNAITPDSELKLTTSIGQAHINLYGSGQQAVIVSHGWADSSQSFKHIIQALVKQGYLVAAIDHIGHGKSSGNKSHLASFIETKTKLMAHLESQRVTIKSIIGHSMGAFATLNLSEEQLKNKKIILIASPIKFFELMFEKVEQVGISRKLLIRTLEKITKQYGLTWQRLGAENHRAKLNLDMTFIHDKNDRYAPFNDIENYLYPENQDKNLHKDKLISTQGLGHSRILGDTHVINSINQVLAT